MTTTVFFRKLIYITLSFVDSQILRRRNNLFVLCYHSIASDGWRFSVDFKTFQTQMNWLLHYYQPITLEDLNLYLNGVIKFSRPSFVLTFDDGYKDLLGVADFCQKHNIKPGVMVISDPKRADRSQLKTNKELLNWGELRLLIKLGWSVGCHSATHSDFNRADKIILEREIIQAKDELRKRTGQKISYFSYPKGIYSGNILKMVEDANFQLGFTMDDDLINPKTRKLLVPRIGVDRTHSFYEFQASFSPSVIMIRKQLKRLPIFGNI